LPKLRVGNPLVLVGNIEIAAVRRILCCRGSKTLASFRPLKPSVCLVTPRRADAPPINLEGTPIHSGSASIHFGSSNRRTYVNFPQP
jgi:hypothetical protein